MEDSLDPGRRLDAEARLLAQTIFDRAVVLEAGAGTGKTAALVARIVAWSVGPGWERARAEVEGTDVQNDTIASRVLDGIVAITFTDDAAAEMAQRVAQALDELQGDVRLGGNDHWPDGAQVITGLNRVALPDELGVVRSRASALLSVIERLRTSTIHAFARDLVARFPVEAGLNPSFEVDADGRAVEELVERSVEEVIGDAYRGEAFESEALLLAGRAIGPVEIRDAVAALVGDGGASEALAQDPMNPQRLAPIVSRLIETLDAVVPVAEKLTGAKGSRTVAAAQWILDLAGRERGDVETSPAQILDGLARWIREQPDWDENLRRLNAWGITYTYTKSEQEVFESVSEAQFDAVCRLARMMEFVPNFDPEVFGALRRILHEVLGRVENEKRRRGIVGFQDLLTGARSLLENHPLVLRSLRAEITQLLVDEMQDTDGEQARIVELLGLEDEQDQGPGLFLVGDPKQSIYGWRNADMQVYRHLVHKVKDQGGDIRSLTVNFRSVQEVLDEVGRLVEPVMIEEEGVQPAFESLLAAKELGGQSGWLDGKRAAVEHWVSTAADEDGIPSKTSAAVAADLEAEAVARDVASLRESGTPLGEMAVLMRSRGHQASYLEALRRYGVPYVVGKDPNYYRTREVIEVMALVRLVLDPFDSLALVCVLRSPMVGVPDAALRPLWKAGLPSCTLRLGTEGASEDLGALIETAVLEVETLDLGPVSLEALSLWPKALGRFLEKLRDIRRSFEVDLPDVFLENLRLGLAPEPLAACRFPGAYRLANLDRFFRDLEQILADGGTADTILRHLRRAEREKPDETSGRPRSDDDGVRVLTIHGAKGLGFEHVWLIQTHAASSSKGRSAGADVEKVAGQWEMELRGFQTPCYAEVMARRTRMEDAERARLLYVALTRAKNRLVTVGNWMPTRGIGPMLKSFGSRVSGWPRLEELWQEESQGSQIDLDGARWVWLGHPRWDAETPKIEGLSHQREAIDPARIEADDQQLGRWKERALERQVRPWLGTASQEGHDLFEEIMADRLEGVEDEPRVAHEPGVGQWIAMAVGTAMHGVLEGFDLGAPDLGAELSARVAHAFVWLDGVLTRKDLRMTARDRLEDLAERFKNGPLWRQFLALDGYVLARELPLVTTPGGGRAVGAVTGAIDLVYRDGDAGEIVVADFKTDHLKTDDEIRERAAVYRPQLEIYARALQEAMNLEVIPRQELWFIESGVVHCLQEAVRY